MKQLILLNGYKILSNYPVRKRGKLKIMKERTETKPTSVVLVRLKCNGKIITVAQTFVHYSAFSNSLFIH